MIIYHAKCDNCGHWNRVYHLAWSAIDCVTCGSEIENENPQWHIYNTNSKKED